MFLPRDKIKALADLLHPDPILSDTTDKRK